MSNFKGLDLMISYDTTGSMYPVLTQTKTYIEKTVKNLFGNIPDIRIGIIAHGDYCDAGNPYTIRILDLTTDQNSICNFVKTTERTFGGDADECYELVLNQARTQINWGSGREKILMVIGDAQPHGVNYPQNKNKIDWKNEVGLLNEAGVRIFAVQAKSFLGNSNFYKTMASKTDGVYLSLDQFADITNLISAACYSQYSEEALNEFVTVIKDNGQLNKNMAKNLSSLTGGKVSVDYDEILKSGLTLVEPGRFQVMPITTDVSIKQFIEDNGITFKKGRAFYQMTKKETVGQYKEIVLQNKSTGELYTGPAVREMLKLQPQIEKGGAKETFIPDSYGEYRIFVQSNSHNRKLPLNTCILYEVNEL